MRWALLTAVAALAAAPPADAIVNADGSGPIPSAALITSGLSTRAALRCGGTIRDARHVVTAAHCTYDGAGHAVPARRITVVAGVTSATAPEPTAQWRRVVAVSTDPAYARRGAGAVHDSAILTLEQPLALGGPVDPLPLAEPGGVARGGSFSGWGRTAPHGRGGVLRHAALDVLPPQACARFGLRFERAVMLCAGGTAAGGCQGDSGGALVAGGRLVGIASFVGPRLCGDRRYPTVFTRVGAPTVNAFLRQADPPPRPVFTARPVVAGRGPTLRCTAGHATGGTALAYAFRRAPVVRGTLLKRLAVPVGGVSPDASYWLAGTELGEAVFCVARAAGLGGSAKARSRNAIGLGGSIAV